MISKDINIQLLIDLFKAYGINKVIASPGTENANLIASLQEDTYFKIFSSADERSAAYMACGMSVESKEPVIITCTGATASRNYMPGLTEAYYRKIPVIAITCGKNTNKLHQLIPQVIDRRTIPNDIVISSVFLSPIRNEEDRRHTELCVNEALSLLLHYNMPIHINLSSSWGFTNHDNHIKANLIRIITHGDEFPVIPQGRIGVFIGSKYNWNNNLKNQIEHFCNSVNGVVLCDHTSNYEGNYKIQYSLIGSQEFSDNRIDFELLIHIGEVSGDYFMTDNICARHVWRVSEDGKFCDTFMNLQYVFKMSDDAFFSSVSKNVSTDYSQSQYDIINERYERIRGNIKDIPFSNVGIAQILVSRIPHNSVVHLGILNSLRSWNFFKADKSIRFYSNVGGFGIDGGLSTMIGAALCDPQKLYYCIVGDLAFFYDMNVLGNRHIPNNIRIMLINNGRGTEFHNYFHGASQIEGSDSYIAAAGHYGNKSPLLVKHYSEDLGFSYLSANNYDEFMGNVDMFMSPQIANNPILFEVFTDSDAESEAIRIIRNIEKGSIKKKVEKRMMDTARKIVSKL